MSRIDGSSSMTSTVASAAVRADPEPRGLRRDSVNAVIAGSCARRLRSGGPPRDRSTHAPGSQKRLRTRCSASPACNLRCAHAAPPTPRSYVRGEGDDELVALRPGIVDPDVAAHPLDQLAREVETHTKAAPLPE